MNVKALFMACIAVFIAAVGLYELSYQVDAHMGTIRFSVYKK